MSSQQLQLPVASSSSSSSSRPSISSQNIHFRSNNSLHLNCKTEKSAKLILSLSFNHHRRPISLVRVSADDNELVTPASATTTTTTAFDDDDEDEVDPSPEDLEYVGQIKRVLELLKKNRDMLFGEVKLTIMIEDPRDAERKRLLGIDDSDGPSREDLVAALEEVNDGKIPRDRFALRMLAEEMINWPNLEVEPSKKTTKTKSLYAKATDTGIDPEVAAKRLNVDWDSAAEIEASETDDDNEVPSAVGYGALYLVTAFPVIIGISVVLILFYNSLQ